MSTKMFNKKSAMVAGTALTAGLALGALNTQTVHADTVNNAEETTDEAQDVTTNVQDAQKTYNDQKAIVDQASQQAQSAQTATSQARAQLDQVNQNVNDLEKDGDVAQTQQNITKQQTVITNTQKSATDAANQAAAHQSQVAEAQKNYDQASQAQNAQADKTKAADQAAQEAQSKIGDKQKLEQSQNDAQNKFDQDLQSYNHYDFQTKQDQKALNDAQSKLDPAQKAADAAKEKFTVSQKADQEAQDAKTDQLNKVSQKQVAYDQEFGKNGTLGMLEKQVNGNLDFENTINLPFTVDQLRAANDQSTDQNWDEIVKASENAYHDANNEFKSESKADDTEKVDPKNLTPAQQRELSEYTLRLINNARGQLHLPKWTYGINTQNLANDIAADYDEHKRSNRQGHYVEGIVREAAKHGLKITGNQIEDLYAFYAPTDAPMTMTEVKHNLYDNLKGMMLGNVCNPGSDPEYHHANDLLGDQPASYALSLSNQPEGDHDFVSTHFIDVTSGQHKLDNGGIEYTGVVDVSKYHGGTWEADPDADKAINEQIAQLKQKGEKELTNLNGLKQELATLSQKAVNTNLAVSAAKSAYDQAAKTLKGVQDQISTHTSALTNDHQSLTQLKQDLTNDKSALAKAKDALTKFDQENKEAIAAYQEKAEAAKAEHNTLDGLTKTADAKKKLLDQANDEQKHLDQLASEAEKAVKTAKATLAKHQAHLAALQKALAEQKTSQADYQTKAHTAEELSKKLSEEQTNLKQAESNLNEAKKIAALSMNETETAEPGDAEVILPGDDQEHKDNHFFVEEETPVASNLTYTVNEPQTAKHSDHSRHIILKKSHVTINNTYNDNRKVVNKIYVPVINHNRNWRVNLYNGHGKKTEQTIATNTTWQVLDQMLIGDTWYYRIGDGEWLPENYVKTVDNEAGKTTAEEAFSGIAHIIATSGMIPLLDANGNFTGKFIEPNTSWKVWAIKWINGEEMVRIGNEQQWVAMKYVSQLVKD